MLARDVATWFEASAGVARDDRTPPGVSPRIAWQAFRAFAAEPIDDIGTPSEDLLLIEAYPARYPPYDFRQTAEPSPAWGVNLARHVSFGDGREMEHLTVVLLFEVPAQQPPGEQHWGKPGLDAQEWITWVERSSVGPMLASDDALLGFWDAGTI